MTAPQIIWLSVAIGGIAIAALVYVRRRRRVRRRRAPAGYGAALAHALDGHFDVAGRRLEALLEQGDVDRADVVLGLVAVRRAAGDLAGARALLDGLGGGAAPPPWLAALQARVALDEGDVERAAEAVVQGERLPLDLTLAALSRAGRWVEALRVYRARCPRKQRDDEVWAALLAGAAVAQAGAGDERGARRGLKRALALAPEHPLVNLAAAWLHPKAGVRAQHAAKLATRLGRAAATLLPPVGIETANDAAAAARARIAEGEPVEEVLGALRDEVDAAPRRWEVRRAYVDLLLEHGTADDWRSELAEIIELAATAAPPTTRLRCARCDFRAQTAFFVCPRCDALGSVEVAGSPVGSSRRARASVEGAEMAKLTRKLGPLGPHDRS